MLVKKKTYRHELHALFLWTRTFFCLLELENMQRLILPYGHFRAFNLIKPICQLVACQGLITLLPRCLMWMVQSLHKCTPWGSLRWSCAGLHLYLLTKKGEKKMALNIQFPVSLTHALRTMEVEIMWHGLRTMREHALYLICLIGSSFPAEFSRQACSFCHNITCAYSEIASKQAELKWFNSWKEGKFKLYLNGGKKIMAGRIDRDFSNTIQ